MTDAQRGQFVDADIEDYRIAYPLFMEIVGRTNDPIGQRVRDFARAILLKALSSEKPFTVAQAGTWTGVSESEARRRLHALEAAGVVQPKEIGRGRRPAVWEFTADYADRLRGRSEGVGVPTPEQLGQQWAAQAAGLNPGMILPGVPR